GNLTQNVSLLRKALGESANGPQFIETVPRRGYRFVAAVNKINGGNGTSVESLGSNQPETFAAPTAPAPVSRGNLGVRKRLPAIVLTLAIVAAAVAGIVYFSTRNKAGAAPAAIQSIAVMPFVDESPNGEAEFLDDEIAESLVNSLTKLPKLRVVPRSVMVTYKGRNVDPRQVGQELNVRAVV